MRAEPLVALATAHTPDLYRVLAGLRATPHRAVVVDRRVVPLWQAHDPGAGGLLTALAHAAALVPATERVQDFEVRGQGFRVTHVEDSRPRITYDTVPNRFARFVLQRYRAALGRAEGDVPEALLRALDGVLARGVLREVSRITHVTTRDTVLQKHPLYRELLWLHVQLGRLTTATQGRGV